MNAIIEHEMIMASAGSGKTYALASRLVRLLALGVPPERIVALTFTRKAAAEFFDVMLKRLAEGAADPAKAQALAQETGCADLTCKKIAALLATVARSIHRINLTTIDSFFVRVVHSFPYELGITGNIEVLDPAYESRNRDHAMRAVFSIADDNQRTAFLESFKRSTFGEAEKNLRSRLENFIEKHHGIYQLHPEQSHWGNKQTIWGNAFPWDPARSDLPAAVACMLSFANTADLPDRSRKPFIASLEALAQWNYGHPLPAGTFYFTKNYLHAAISPPRDIKVGRKTFPLSADEQSAMHTIAYAIVSSSINKAIEQTIGIYEVLRDYDGIQSKISRENGKLSFSDFPLLLLNTLRNCPQVHLDLAYRMDSRFDHWLLDEFQDTSRLQWEVLREFIDEVLQDPSGNGSFFYVGDVKQAIYSWRGGDVSLFNEIFDFYNQGSSAHIRRRDLTDSYRCRPAVIRLVNAVFGKSQVISLLFGGDAARNWNREWIEHKSACTGKGEPEGHAAVFLAPKDDRYNAAASLIEKLDPIRRNMSCAVLVRTNDDATEISEVLRSRNIPTVLEGKILPGADNQLGLLIRAIVSAAAHPTDRFSREYLMMTPLAKCIDGEAGLARLLKIFRVDVAHSGFNAAISRVFDTLCTDVVLDAFNLQRQNMILAAARRFDSSGQSGYDEFLQYFENYTLPGDAGSNAVQVMTIHRSKGLSFDYVILPNLSGNTLLEARGDLLQFDDHKSKSWALLAPKQEIVECDEILSSQLNYSKHVNCYERLCVLYVAMTRARYATYIFLEEKPISDSSNYETFLKMALDNVDASPVPDLSDCKTLATFGSPYLSSPAEPTPDADASCRDIVIDSRFIAPPPEWATVEKLSPSKPYPTPIQNADPAFPGPDARAFGIRLHEALATIADETDIEPCISRLRSSDCPVDRDVARTLEHAISRPGIRTIFSPPQTPFLLWRERSFEVMIDGKWVSGTFDRVTVQLDASGTPVAADLVDFKSAAKPTPENEIQIALYTQALARILNLPVDRIRATLACLGSE